MAPLAAVLTAWVCSTQQPFAPIHLTPTRTAIVTHHAPYNVRCHASGHELVLGQLFANVDDFLGRELDRRGQPFGVEVRDDGELVSV